MTSRFGFSSATVTFGCMSGLGCPDTFNVNLGDPHTVTCGTCGYSMRVDRTDGVIYFRRAGFFDHVLAWFRRRFSKSTNNPGL